MENKEIITLIGILASSGLSVYSIYRNWVLAQQQRGFQKELDSQKGDVEKKRFTMLLWDKADKLKYIDPSTPIGPIIRDAVNALEIIAQCWENNLVDKNMVIISFGKVYEKTYDDIGKVTDVPGYNRSGTDFLNSNRVIQRVYDEIQEELKKRNM